MRNALTILLALAAGVLLNAWWSGRPAVSPHAAATPAAATSAILPQDMADPDMTVDDGERWPDQAPTPEQVLYAQPRMMRQALAELGPRTPGRPNLYLLTFAGDGGEDVFRNEAEYAARLFTRRFGPATHSLVLENNPATLSTRPLASWSNLEMALDGLGKAMQPDDILLLYVTSHGSEDHELLIDMDPLPLDPIGATDLAGILALHPFKWKVVVINACYSGGFLPPLRGPGTMVLTAARSDRSSFGCGSDSDITYFGKAWLVDALNHSDNFADAFTRARNDIAAWEKQDNLTPSEPQIDIGSGIRDQLARWRKGITPGPAVPFEPAAPTAAGSRPTP
ncbi:caspase family protein [Rhodanobacter sp. FDAARGOS 1247]|uniref:C13 family peptidase n=1 Tax=Rhodanobacter sp. FDAARGOS 1247 TaxID=2778082 RepID=UPI0019528F83|nr:C13 family peptidase [Rhodanobacter sp. FDAARGOS 1247]QRP65165.1 caspase family protein [Rhodanobacter sp. FDAARGOS 1247]